MQKITPFLWFDDKAEEAANFYVSIFENSKMGSIARYGEEGAQASGRPKGTVMTVTFELDGEEFIALNDGPHFTFTEAVSFCVNCETQQEVDELWEKLSACSRPTTGHELFGWKVRHMSGPSALRTKQFQREPQPSCNVRRASAR